MIEGLVSVMSDEKYEPEHPLLIAFRSIWLRICHVSVNASTLLYNAEKYSRLPLKATTILLFKPTDLTMCTGVQTRFATSMTAYCDAIMQQVHLQSTAGLTSTVEELLILRRDSIATTPIYALIESAISSQFVHGLL